MSISIEVKNVTKNFTLRYHRGLKEVTVAKLKGRETSNTFQALDDVTFTVKQGESVGLMGLNGSGKSTLLKLIQGVMYPDVGTVRTRGQIAGLIATGAGFHPQLSGKENIYLNAAIYGLSREETDAIYDDVVNFADLGRHLESAVGNYSSGQYSRLGFAVAVHIDSDIFLADEVLAVGDKPFKIKCMEKMEEIRDSGRTIVYVSHAAGSVKQMCDRVICLEKGKLVFDGDVDEGIDFLHYGEDDEPKGKGKAKSKGTDAERLKRLQAADSKLGAEV